MDMNINFGSNASIARCIRNHKPLPIVSMFENNNTRYFIFDRENRLFGAFNYSKDGVLSNVRFDNRKGRTKTAVDAILSIKDFIVQRAKADGADFVGLSILANRRNAEKIKQLFSKFDVAEAGFVGGVLKFIGVLNPKKEFEIMSTVAQAPVQKATDSLKAVQIAIEV